MKIFEDFKSYNHYLGLTAPLDSNIDLAYYDPPNMLLKSEAVAVNFYRISFKINFKSKKRPILNP